MADLSRWVLLTTLGQWHRVDEQKTKVYQVTTRCGLQSSYPHRTVVFHHPSDPRLAYPDCQECSR